MARLTNERTQINNTNKLTFLLKDMATTPYQENFQTAENISAPISCQMAGERLLEIPPAP
jgi:hypothetical protein